MEQFWSNPGLEHIGENILKYLSNKDLENCSLVSKSWNNCLTNPIFWLRKNGQKMPREQYNFWRQILILVNKEEKYYYLNIHAIRLLKRGSSTSMLAAPLVMASEAGDLKMLRFIIAKHQYSDDSLSSAFKNAFHNGHLEVQRILLLIVKNQDIQDVKDVRRIYMTTKLRYKPGLYYNMMPSLYGLVKKNGLEALPTLRYG